MCLSVDLYLIFETFMESIKIVDFIFVDYIAYVRTRKKKKST